MVVIETSSSVQVPAPVPTPVPAQVPPPVPAPAPAEARLAPSFLSRNTSFIVHGGNRVVIQALQRLNVPVVVRDTFNLSFSTIVRGGDRFDVDVEQYLGADGQTIVEFLRTSGCTVGFNMFLRGFLLEEMRNYGIATLAGDVVPRAYYPTLQ